MAQAWDRYLAQAWDRLEPDQGDHGRLSDPTFDEDYWSTFQGAQHPVFDFAAHAQLGQSAIWQRESRTPGFPSGIEQLNQD